jgi:methylenetetrahydrofolate dehydrogenase (NADP+) / methenyltetrahydrofolate cyclohydrolase
MADRDYARLIDGASIAAGIRRRVAREAATLAADHGIAPGLTVILVGNDPASEIYVRSKLRHAAEVGIGSRVLSLPSDITQAALLGHIAVLNADPTVDGILVQLPLPSHIDADAVNEAIDPQRDVDGFHPVNAGHLLAGRPTLAPCTPRGCIILLRDALGDLAGANALVLGRSNIVGKPLGLLLLRENCTVTIAHSRSRDLPALCRRADILVAAIGQPEFVRGAWLKPGATVIDVGINRIERPGIGQGGERRIVGDVAFAEARAVAGAITPVPGGVGPMTIACLLENTIHAANWRRGIALPPSQGQVHLSHSLTEES